jgi:hypothetical protein
VEVKWSVHTAWADAEESAYVRVLHRERGRSIILSKDRRVRQRWRRSRRGRRASERSRRGSEDLRGGDSEADGIKPPYRDLR